MLKIQLGTIIWCIQVTRRWSLWMINYISIYIYMKYTCNSESISPQLGQKDLRTKIGVVKNRQLGSSKLFSYFDKSKTSPNSIKSVGWINKNNWSRSKKPKHPKWLCNPAINQFHFSSRFLAFYFCFFSYKHASRYYLGCHFQSSFIYIYI